jgi:hypothetical protein
MNTFYLLKNRKIEEKLGCLGKPQPKSKKLRGDKKICVNGTIRAVGEK